MDAKQRKLAIFGAAALLVLMAIYQWGVVPAMEYKQELISRQEQARVRLKELRALSERYERAKRSAGKDDSVGSKPSGFTLFSYLETRASKDGLKQKIDYMRPSTKALSGGLEERMVQMRLERVALETLIRFLRHVEFAREGIYVKRITIRSPRSNPGELKVDLVFSTFEAGSA
jgi:general secretion pathway protein M